MLVGNPMMNVAPWTSQESLTDYSNSEEYRMRLYTRKGKWTEEEETYTMKLIEAFIAGVLPLPQGTTLRSFLSEKLSCDPMRITKKFAGSNGIGKQIFAASPETEKTVEVRRAIMQEIGELEQRFRKRIDYSMAAAPLSLSSFGNLDGGPVEPVCFNSYRVHIPNDDVPPPFASNAELVKFLNLRKDVFSVAEPRGGQVQSEPLYSVASQMKRLLKPEVDSPVYVDENYRVHGFQPVFVKKEAAKVEVQANFKERVPFKPKPEIKLEGSAAFVKQPKLPKPPKEPKEPKAAKQPSSLKAKSDPIQDLQASALLLDFFRSAMMKEVAEDSEGSHSDLADEIAPKRTKLV